MYTTPAITVPQSFLEIFRDNVFLQMPESPEFIDAYIRKLRREMKRPQKKGFWQWLTKK